MKSALVMTYKKVSGFKPGSHGNGRVVIHQVDPKSFEGETQERARFGLHFEVNFSNLGGEVEVTDAYVYLGKFDSLQDSRFKAFQACLQTAEVQVKDRSHIHIVGCDCGGDRKRIFCRKEGFDYIESECGGKETLGQIVRDILKDVPKEEKPDLLPGLELEFVAPAGENGWSSLYVKTLASVDDILIAGCSDGRLFWRKDGGWKKTPLQMKQGVTVIAQDGDSVLVGDGSCCSGATYRLSLDGRFELIWPVEGQNSRDDLKGNVHGFARRGNELLAGVGGCDGAHVYRLNGDGKWEYHPKDPGLYVTAMLAASDGNVYIAMGQGWSKGSIYRYDGDAFKKLRDVQGGIKSLFEHEGKVYSASTDSGNVSPSNYSCGFINVVEEDSVKQIWTGAGGVSGFFFYKGAFYAHGVNQSNWTTMVLRLEGGEWKMVAKFEETLHIALHNGEVYAGGSRKIDDKKSQPVIYKVLGL